MEKLGSLGGTCFSSAMATHGGHTYALAGCGGQLIIVNADKPDSLREEGRLDLGENVLALVVSDTVAYAAVSTSGLKVIGFGNPAKPTVLGSYSIFAPRDLALSGKRIYIMRSPITKTTVDIVDVTDPRKPAKLGTFEHTGLGMSLAARGNDFLLVKNPDSLILVDAADPALPKVKGTAYMGGQPGRVTVKGGVAYVPTKTFGLLMFDLGLADQPVAKGSMPLDDRCDEAAVHGNHLYVSCMGGLRTFDVADSLQPATRTTLKWAGFPTLSGVSLSGSAGVLRKAQEGLRFLDLANPDQPAARGSFLVGGTTFDAKVAGGLAYLAEYGSIRIVDVSNPSRPDLKGFVTLPSDHTSRVEVAGNLVYLASASGPGLYVFDVSNPAAPLQKSANDSVQWALDLAVSGSYAYVATKAKGLQVVDISKSDTTRVIGAVQLGGGLAGVVLAGGRVYVSGDSGLFILGLSNPAQPALLGALKLPKPAKGLCVKGNTVMVALGYDGLALVDATDPAKPVQSAIHKTSGEARQVSAWGKYALVSDFNGGLRAVDVSDPANPRYEDNLKLPGSVNGIFVQGDIAYVSGHAGGLHAVRLGAAPVKVGSGPVGKPAGYHVGWLRYRAGGRIGILPHRPGKTWPLPLDALGRPQRGLFDMREGYPGMQGELPSQQIPPSR